MRRAVLALLVAAVVAACGRDPGGSTAPAEVIEVFGPYKGTEADRFVESLDPFVERTGIEVRYTGSGTFARDLEVRAAESNDPPDIALVPQPGLVRALTEADRLVRLDDATLESLEATTAEGVRSFGVVDGVPVGVPFRITVKSLVWYRPSIFADHGWEVPATLDELDELVEDISDSAVTAPWCLGTDAGPAGGWPATDWVEDLLLRDAGAERYREWAAGALPFTSPEVEDAYAHVEDLVLAPGRALGGRSGAAGTRIETAGSPLFDEPPGCALFKQADFALSWLADARDGATDDLDFFVLPGPSADRPAPLVVGGDLAVAFSDRPAVAELMTYLAGPDADGAWVGAGGFVSPKATTRPADYPEGTERAVAELLRDGRTVVFDASDSMPPEIGSDLLWSQTNRWLAGGLPYDELAATLDAALAALDEGSRTPG